MNSDAARQSAILLAEQFSYKICLIKALATRLGDLLASANLPRSASLRIQEQIACLDNMLIETAAALDESVSRLSLGGNARNGLSLHSRGHALDN